jgi:hypothetical protein
MWEKYRQSKIINRENVSQADFFSPLTGNSFDAESFCAALLWPNS